MPGLQIAYGAIEDVVRAGAQAAQRGTHGDICLDVDELEP